MKDKAEEHAEWFAKAVRFVYSEAFKHGYKHGLEDSKISLKRS